MRLDERYPGAIEGHDDPDSVFYRGTDGPIEVDGRVYDDRNPYDISCMNPQCRAAGDCYCEPMLPPPAGFGECVVCGAYTDGYDEHDAPCCSKHLPHNKPTYRVELDSTDALARSADAFVAAGFEPCKIDTEGVTYSHLGTNRNYKLVYTGG